LVPLAATEEHELMSIPFVNLSDMDFASSRSVVASKATVPFTDNGRLASALWCEVGVWELLSGDWCG